MREEEDRILAEKEKLDKEKVRLAALYVKQEAELKDIARREKERKEKELREELERLERDRIEREAMEREKYEICLLYTSDAADE